MEVQEQVSRSMMCGGGTGTSETQILHTIPSIKRISRIKSGYRTDLARLERVLRFIFRKTRFF